MNHGVIFNDVFELKVSAITEQGSRSVRSRSPVYGRRTYKDDDFDDRRSRRSRRHDGRDMSHGRDRYEPGHGGDYERKRSRYEGSKRGSGTCSLFVFLSFQVRH